MSEQAVSRWIRGYESSGDELCVEERLPTSWTLEALAKLVRAGPADAKLYHVYPLDQGQLAALAKTLESDLPGDCAYYLEADP